MARGDYGPEIRSSLGTGQPGRVNMSPPRESPADMMRDASKGIKEGSPQDQKLDAMPRNQARPSGVAVIAGPRPPGVSGSPPPDLHHVAAATSIAHAILNRSGGGGP